MRPIGERRLSKRVGSRCDRYRPVSRLPLPA